MDFDLRHPSHLKNPLRKMLVGVLLLAVGVSVVFVVTEKLMPISGEWHPYVSALPGVALCSLFLVLFSYLRHHDELKRQLGTQALATSAVVGVSALVVSVSRSEIGGYPEFSGGIIMVTMALTFVVTSIFLSWRHR